MPRLRSLTLRLALLAAAWVAAGLGLAAWLILAVATETLLRGFDSRLVGLLDAVAVAAAVGPDGRPRLGEVRALSEPFFGQPFSGYYWQIAVPGGGRVTSRSLWDTRLPGFAIAAGAGPAVRDLPEPGPRGQRLRVAERSVVPAEGSTPLLVQVAQSRDDMDRDIRRLRLLLGGLFGVLGLGLVGGVAGQVVLGLAPLRRARAALAEVRAGARDRLGDARAPREIAPLLEEIDALVAQNRATVERARTHVGNLAHALKTPLAVQRTALADPPDLATARAQGMAMERLVQHHLARARATALAGAAASGTSPVAVAGDLARALRRLFADRGLEILVDGETATRVGVDQQDLAEMIGNLLENACKWARRRVAVAVAARGGMVEVAVTDDGPGLPPEQRAAALARGARLDEAAPGSGLGLAIVQDLVALHGGRLTLEDAPGGGLRDELRGGLRAVLVLPAR
jgi:signal transduction histidine kinase